MSVRYRRDSPGRKARFTDSPDSLDWQIQAQRTFRFCAIWQSGESGESGETPVTRKKRKREMDTRTIKVRVDAALAEAVADKSIKRWSTTCHSNGRKYVNVTFEQVAVIGKID